MSTKPFVLLLGSTLLLACDAPDADGDPTDTIVTDTADDDGETEALANPIGDASGIADDADLDLRTGGEAGPVGISVDGYVTWGGGPLNLGSDANKTCFLEGVTGELYGAWQGTPARARVFQQGGDWFIEANAGDGAGVFAYASCIQTAANRQPMSWSGNNIDFPHHKASLPRTSNMYCFLTEVTATVGFWDPDAYVQLARTTTYVNGVPKPIWTLGGHLQTEQDGTSGGSASAVCVDIPSQTIEAFSRNSPANSSATSTLGATPNRACGLHTLSGHFAVANQGLGDGGRLFFQNGFWKAFASAGKFINGECLFTSP